MSFTLWMEQGPGQIQTLWRELGSSGLSAARVAA